MLSPFEGGGGAHRRERHHCTALRGPPRHHRLDCGGKPVLSDQSVFQSHSQSQAAPVAGAAHGYAVADDFYVTRPVDQYVHAPSPLFPQLTFHRPATFCLVKSGDHRRELLLFSRNHLDAIGFSTRATGEARRSLFRFCSGRKSVHPHSNSRGPTCANSSRVSIPPGTPARLLTLSAGSSL